MRIAIIGLGGVGGYIAASLAQKTSHEVVGFARGEHLKSIQQNGLKIIEDETTFISKFHTTTLQESRGYFDIVLFCVKSYDLENSFHAIKNHIDKNTILLSFSNGVNSSEVLKNLSDSKVLDGCIYILSHIKENGVIRKKGKVFAAVFGGLEQQTQVLKEVFEEVQLRVKTPLDIKTAIWKKYIFIAAFASMTSYYDKTIGYIYEHHYNEVKDLLQEIADVALAKGIEIQEEVEKSLITASKVPYDSSTSMHLDFQKNKKTELQTLSYYIIDEGKKMGIKIPIMEKIYTSLSTKTY